MATIARCEVKADARRVAREIADARLRGGATKEDLDRWLLMLAIKKRRVRPRDPARSARRATVKELDALARAIAVDRAGGTCDRCQRGENIQWAHVYTRRYRWLRWDPDNSMILCSGCHLWWHQHPADAISWWEEEHDEEYVNRLKAKAARPQKTDLTLVRLHLLQEAKRLGVKIG